MKRRNFLVKSSLGGFLLLLGSPSAAAKRLFSRPGNTPPAPTPLAAGTPVAIATWNFPNAVAAAWEVLRDGGSALDAVERGVRVEEADVSNATVGKGGRPDRDGHVTLDACVMDAQGNYGAVMCLENVTHAVSVARKVMEDSPHAILVGKGAEEFALQQGFPVENLLTEESRREWEQWRKTANYQPEINIENHDTIGMLALDSDGHLSGACTTSGLAYKMHGRVGDSPVVGAGLYIDNEVGGAAATGLGEEVLKVVGSFLVVEFMRQGRTPQQACEEAVRRVIENARGRHTDFQVGFIALNKQGETGAYSIHKGFSSQIQWGDEGVNREAPYFME
jgi:N4-(beta-N-acetylglucosaminyl)-L-asparaginase